MDARSPLSPRTLNTQRTSEKISASEKVKAGPQKGLIVKFQPAEASNWKQPTRRFSFVSWLANFEVKEMKADSQKGVILSQQDHNLKSAEKDQKTKPTNQKGTMSNPSERQEPLERPVSESTEASVPSGDEESALNSQKDSQEPSDEDAIEDEVDWDSLPSEEDVTTYAEYLGMKPKEDKELRWIAEQAMLCPVPDGWQEGVDRDGVTYFYELDTMTSCRAHPCDNDYKFLYRGLRRAIRESAVTFEAVVIMADHLGIDVATEPHLLWVARHALLAPLLPGWEELEDEEGSYYYDKREERSTGTHPIDAFFQRLVVTERMKRKDSLKRDKDGVALKDEDACVMELLDEESGELYAYDWSKAEMQEPESDVNGNERESRGVELFAVLQGVAGSVWRVPVGAWALLVKTWSLIFQSPLTSTA